MYFAPWPSFEEDEIQAVVNVLKSGKINQWTGNEVNSFEREFAQSVGLDYSIALANGSLALDLSLRAFAIGHGDEVIVTSRSFIASASCVVLRGATPVFVDVDPVSQNITIESISKAVTSKTKAVIAVNLAGWPCALDKIKSFCEQNDMVLIEDCAQSHGAQYKERKVGSFGDCSIFSFCQDKIISTGGEGGMLLTNDKKIWEKVWSYKDHGKKYDQVFLKEHDPGFRWVIENFGTNCRMTEMQAAIGRRMLKKLDRMVEKRRFFADFLNQNLKNIPGLRVTIPTAEIYHSYY
ncbi:DegT/DnrJ/EryC1/StrS aminotransferase family protein, partial [Desulfobacterales bacterium HSG17]|nr:DegT/DnrJ/EryC1/StrS aminotransferase family protein [Desulfobacterales bacterium HSG17]